MCIPRWGFALEHVAPGRSRWTQRPDPQEQLWSGDRLLRRDLGGPQVCRREWKPRVGLCRFLTCKVSPIPHSTPQFLPLEFQYGLWEAIRRTGVSRYCSLLTPPTYRERVPEGLRLPTRAHARPDPGSRSASPSRVPGLSQLLLRFAAGATSKGCGYPGAERRGSAGRWGAVGRRGHRGLDVGKHFPTSAKGRHGGTKQVSLSRAFGVYTPLRRGIWMDQMTSRARPPSPDSPEFLAPPRLRHPRNPQRASPAGGFRKVRWEGHSGCCAVASQVALSPNPGTELCK